jgi:DNA-binding SARP family transcriptional activator
VAVGRGPNRIRRYPQGQIFVPITYRVQTLGSPRLLADDGSAVEFPIGKPFALLVHLALSGGGADRSSLARLLWSRAEPARARHSLRQALSLIRQSLGEDILASDDPVALAPGRVRVDVEVVEERLRVGDVAAALEAYGGGFLDSFALLDAPEWERWVDEVRDRLVEDLTGAVQAEAGRQAASGAWTEALALLDAALVVAPYSFDLAVARVRVMLDSGRVAEAAEALSRARTAFGDDLAGEALRELDRRLAELRTTAVQPLGDPPLEFVGRAAELARLMAVWRAAQREGSQVVVVTGEAGMGKTRLVLELERSARAAGPAVSARVQASPPESGMRWSVAGELIRQLLTLPGAAGISGASDRLLRSMVPSLAEQGGSAPRGVTAVALSDAVRDLIAAVAYEAPLLLMVDDWQCADPESAALLARVARHLDRDPVLLVLSYRPAESGSAGREMLGALVGALDGVLVELAPLSRADVDELLLLSGYCGTTDESQVLIDRLHQSSAGNPLFLVELIGGLLAEGVLARSGPRLVLSGDVPDPLPVPGSVLALLDRRLEECSEDARIVLAAVAHESRPASVRRLRELTGRSEEAVTAGATEAVGRNVLRWLDDRRLDFAHDQLRFAARRKFDRVATPRPRRPRRAIAAALAVITAGIGAATFVVAGNPSSSSADSGSYGGGSIMVLADSAIQLRPTDGTPAEWLPGPAAVRVPEPGAHPFRVADGGVRWLMARAVPGRGPDLVELIADGGSRLVASSAGDDLVGDLSGDGTRFLVRQQRTGEATYSKNLVLVDEALGQSRIVYRGGDHIRQARWDHVEDRIAILLRGQPDTVLVVSNHGEELFRRTFRRAIWLDWCADRVAVLAEDEETGGTHARLHLTDPSPGGATSVSRVGIAPLQFACSPDGSAVVYRRVVGGELSLALLDLGTDAVHPLALPARHPVFWLADRPAPTPRALVLADREIHLHWGDRWRAVGSLVMSDGSRRSADLTWRALDPAIASVSEDGILSANRRGVAALVAGWGASLRDTLVVHVAGEQPRDARFHDDFVRVDPARWLGFGSHVPVPDQVDGEPVLRITGDANYQDGLLLREPLALERGTTVEFEFRLRPNAPVHQHVAACLLDIRNDYDPAVLQVTFPPRHQELCLVYPVDDLARFDPTALRFHQSFDQTIRLPEILPTDGWVHVALQVSAGGEASLVVEREHVASHPVRLATEPKGAWHLVLFGRAVGVDVFIRNLSVWDGLRYAAH